MTNPSIEAIGLSKRYGSFSALAGLTFKAEGPKCVGLLGPNGAGKTTTLKILTDMIRPSEGSVFINGVSVQEDKRRALESCGTLIESPEIYPSLTPRQALSMVAELRGVPRPERVGLIDRALEEVKMADSGDKKLGRLSKGMKQRVNIAAALLCEPEVILLDEPTTGLDPRGMSEVRDLVNSLKGRKRLIFMSSHLLNEVEEVCDEIAIIDHGRLLTYGTLEGVKSKFASQGETTTVEIELSRPISDHSQAIARVSSLPHVVSAESVGPRTLLVKLRRGQGVQEDLLREVGALDLGMTSFKATTSALEESYLNLVKESE